MKFNRRAEMLVQRFFEIVEGDGEWNEFFLIRDLLLEEYIAERFSFVQMIQIDDIVEEELERFYDDCEIVNDYESEELTRLVYNALFHKNIEMSVELINMYSDCSNCDPYVYYCMVRELERLTGENYIELVVPVSGI